MRTLGLVDRADLHGTVSQARYHLSVSSQACDVLGGTAPMPTTPAVDFFGLFIAALAATVLVTPVLSAVVLWQYRRAVASSMRATAPGHSAAVMPPPVPARPDTNVPVPSVVVLESVGKRMEGADETEGWRRTRDRMRTTAAVYAGAAVAYGLVLAAVWVHLAGASPGLRGFVGLAALFTWLLVPTVLTVLAAARRTQLLAGAAYVALVLLTTAGTGIAPIETLSLMATNILPAGIGLLALSTRNLRAVGPFLAVPVLLLIGGLLYSPWPAYHLMVAGLSLGAALAVGALGAVLLGLLGFAHLAWSALRYADKRASDQMLQISQWWFFLTVVQSMLLVPAGLAAGAAAWLAYVAFRLVLATGMRLTRPEPNPPLRLLLLRTFGAQQRSEALLRRLGAHWRHLGTVQMIAGTDLAAAALEPHEFFDRLRGRLARQFIGDTEELRRRLAQLDERPDPDGRYRVNELFCHDNTWREALRELVRRSDCVLLDLRGFTCEHTGVIYEITQLVELVPLDRVVVLVDDATDDTFVRTTLAEAGRNLGPNSPNRGGGRLRLLPVPRRDVDPRILVDQLAAAAVRRAASDGRPRPSTRSHRSS